ncbi:uncharacterized protein [Heptranchias perlo]|uniref:uncharacterized protein n=1 Tax=Heptranchias perlo TaxID=212740 RepID=UPI0035596E03
MKRNSDTGLRGSQSLPEAVGPGSPCGVSAEEPEGHQELDDEPEYKKQLYRLFGPRVAKSFLQPQFDNPQANPWVQEILERMGGQVSAEDLWRIVREDSRSLLEAYSQELQGCGLDRRTGAGVNKHLSPGVNVMRRAFQLQQGHTTLILSSNPLPNLNDSAGLEGPRRFLGTSPTPSCGTKDEEFSGDPEWERLTLHRLTSGPNGIKGSSKHYRFLTVGDFAIVGPSDGWRHGKGEKCSESKRDKTAQFHQQSGPGRRAEIQRASIETCPVNKN